MSCPAGAGWRLSQSKSVTKTQEADVASGGCGGRRSAATVAPLQHSHSAVGFRDAPPAAREGSSRRRKAARGGLQAKLQASRAFFRSLFVRTSCSDNGAAVRARTKAAAPYGDTKKGGCNKAPFGEIKNGYSSTTTSSSRVAEPTTLRRSIEQEKLMDEAELAARQRKSFSGVIRWRHATTTSSSPASAPAPAPKPLSSSSARRSSVAGGIGPGQLKRSNSARSESEGLIQGAIAYCKRSQQQLGLARKSVSDAAAALCPGPPPSYSWPSNPTRSAPAYCYYY
ncbi:hypothetical protein PR202_ga26147 [Eleusine coracana subsp. coracana]|uniref:Uncharacterized protein n=1 Tax=Eleusine coracana subsp. coracana TaxID=191504 RepID=A0AAV5DDP6_ELECO|nr:hypothetical protein PR202_ga26147 [Eleusine coracana subsp. coracana]